MTAEALSAPFFHADRHASGGADDLLVNTGWDDGGDGSRYTVTPKGWNQLSYSNTTGMCNFSCFIARRTFTLTKLATLNRGTAGVGGSLARMGLYSLSAVIGGDLTLVARTASDATLWSTAFTLYERTLDTAGAFPASYQIVKGQPYATGIIWVGSGTAPSISGPGPSNAASVGGMLCIRQRLGQADLPTTLTNALAIGGGNTHWSELS